MAIYLYKARNKLGEVISGEMESASNNAVAENLISNGSFPFEIKEKNLSESSSGKSEKINVLVFTRQLYILVKSGVPISRALKSLENSSEDEGNKLVFKDLKASLDNGYEMSVALQKHKESFTPFYINMIKVGETTGRLEEVLSELYSFLQFDKEIKTRAKTALRYPFFVLGVMVLAFTLMMIVVIPTFADIYKSFSAALPLPTRILIGTSNFMISYGFLILILIVAIIYLFINYIKTDIGSFWWGKFKFDIPIVGKIIKKSLFARFSKSFSLSLKSGIPVVQSLKIIENILENPYFEKHVENIRESIEKGNTLFSSIKATGVFEPLVIEMLSTGEEAGELDTMCDEISKMYDSDIEYDLKNLSAYIEPIMLIIIGVLLLILALGIFLPMWDLGNVVMKK